MSEEDVSVNKESTQESEQDKGQLTSIIGVMREAYFMEGYGLAEVDKIVGRPPGYSPSDQEGSSEDIGYLCRN